MRPKNLFEHTLIIVSTNFLMLANDCVFINQIKAYELGKIAPKICNLKLIQLAAQQSDLSPGKVYFDSNEKLYYKIYSGPSAQMDLCMQAIRKSFFDGLAPIKHLVLDNGRLVGYCTKAGLSTYSDKQIAIATYAGWGTVFDDIEKQPPEFKLFCKELFDRMLQHGYIFTDFAPWNVIFCDGKYQLIDIESLMEPAQLAQNKSTLFDTILLYTNLDKTHELSKMLRPFLTEECLEELISLAHNVLAPRKQLLSEGVGNRIAQYTDFMAHKNKNQCFIARCFT